MINWLYSRPNAEAISYFSSMLKKRTVEKNLRFCPCQVELVSTKDIPSILSYYKLSSLYNYYDWCHKITGLKSRFVDIFLPPFSDKLCIYNKKIDIIIDTREQLPLWETNNNNNNIKIEKLDYGDYKLIHNEKSLVFERKSIADFIATLSSGYFRFRRELDRVKEQNDNLIIIVEASIFNILNFKNHGRAYSKTRITPEYIFHNVRKIIQDYECCQFLFVDNRDIMRNVMVKCLFMDGDIHKRDLQLAYDLKFFE